MYATPSPTTPRLAAFNTLLREYDPLTHFKRLRLREALLTAARNCREDAEHLRQRTTTFRKATGVSLNLLGHAAPRTLPTTPEGWEAQATEYEHMAEHVFDQPSAQT